MKIGWRYTGVACLLSAAVATGVLIHLDAERKTFVAWRHHLVEGQAVAKQEALRIGKSFGSLYENLRTLSLLPSVRKIDRYGSTLGDDGLETMQQVYNNLASNIDVSEVYVVPSSLDHLRLDVKTGKLEEPILMFDQMIVNRSQTLQSLTPKRRHRR